MARKSRLDVIKEKFGGKWSYDQHNRFVWNCSDGRSIVKQRNCNCWATNSAICNCKNVFIMRDAGKNYEVDIDDNAIYEFNGTSTVLIKDRKKKRSSYRPRFKDD